ncbi:centrosomal protein of 55 kDa-like isoform X2 [Betta splendens]|uniref:Centrosomal protein of 55 kDa-like isoform X2 n=1 Tax=Betta splendens TaxID=158456 RepID=A0A8M1H3A6_BETSP|nr:centrosomal protein of 55 kDa-like isoform X2 [Betta splendens]
MAEMASSKYKVSLKKKLSSELSVVVSSLRKERGHLKQTLAELSCQHAQLYRLVERVLSLETVRQGSCQHHEVKDQRTASASERCSERGGSLAEGGGITCEVEQLRSQIANMSARCQRLEKKVAGKKYLMPNSQGSTTSVEELQHLLRDALEKNKHWLEYDQHREAYVRGILDRMLWLEKQLNEANQARSMEHKEDHSDEKKELVEMQELYETFLHKAKDDLEELRKEVDLTHKSLVEMREMSLLEDHCCFENEDQQLRELQCRLDVVKRRSANYELQANLIQKCMLNRHHEDQERIADLERQREQEDPPSCEEAQPPSQLSRQNVASSSCSSFLNESFLECPGCLAEYPASHYRELMNHMEICLD